MTEIQIKNGGVEMLLSLITLPAIAVMCVVVILILEVKNKNQ